MRMTGSPSPIQSTSCCQSPTSGIQNVLYHRRITLHCPKATFFGSDRPSLSLIINPFRKTQIKRLNRSRIMASRGHRVPALLELLLDEIAVLPSKVLNTIRNRSCAFVFQRFRFTFILQFLIMSPCRLLPIVISIEILLIVKLSIDPAEIEKIEDTLNFSSSLYNSGSPVVLPLPISTICCALIGLPDECSEERSTSSRDQWRYLEVHTLNIILLGLNMKSNQLRRSFRKRLSNVYKQIFC
jgi:hypothetical protein